MECSKRKYGRYNKKSLYFEQMMVGQSRVNIVTEIRGYQNKPNSQDNDESQRGFDFWHHCWVYIPPGFFSCQGHGTACVSTTTKCPVAFSA